MKTILVFLLLLISVISFAQDARIAYYEKALAADTSSAQAHYSLASILALDSTNDIRAEKEYTKAIELDPKNPYYLLARADVRIRQKKYDQAIEDAYAMRQIQGLDSYFGNKIIVLCLYAREETERLQKFLRLHQLHEVDNSPPDPEFQYFLGELYEGWGEPEKACPYFQQAVMDIESLLQIAVAETLDKQLKQYQEKANSICK